MEPFYRDYYARLAILHDGIDDALADLPSEAVDFVPGPEMNSLAVLATHVAGAQRYWVATVAGGEPTERVRDHEFAVSGRDAEALRALLRATLAHSQTVLARLQLDDLSRLRPSPQHDSSYTVANALLHALDHTAEHMGHMQMIRQIWDQRSNQ